MAIVFDYILWRILLLIMKVMLKSIRRDHREELNFRGEKMNQIRNYFFLIGKNRANIINKKRIETRFLMVYKKYSGRNPAYTKKEKDCKKKPTSPTNNLRECTKKSLQKILPQI